MYIKELNINQEGGYMEKVIEVKNLYKLYRVGDEVVRALDGVDFQIKKGEFCAIVGTSGSGKAGSDHQGRCQEPFHRGGQHHRQGYQGPAYAGI